MAQYDVYANPTVAQREAFPYFVVLQSDQLSVYSTRLAMPLARAIAPAGAWPRRLSQTVEVNGERLLLAPQLCAALPERLLRKPVATLRGSAAVLTDALGAVISGV
ncbi:MAG: CcdB family protein [Rubrivivax sp.]|nr:CcdB family protein [Rubrivivax sp.]